MKRKHILHLPTCLPFPLLFILLYNINFPSAVIFFLPKKTSFNISNNASLLMITSVNFWLSRKVFILLSFFEDVFVDYRILC